MKIWKGLLLLRKCGFVDFWERKVLESEIDLAKEHGFGNETKYNIKIRCVDCTPHFTFCLLYSLI